MVRAQVTNGELRRDGEEVQHRSGRGAKQRQLRRLREAGDGRGILERNGRRSSRARSRSRSSRSSAIHIIQRLPYAEAKNDFAAQVCAGRRAHRVDRRTWRRLRRPPRSRSRTTRPATMKTVAEETGEAPQRQDDARDVQRRRAHGGRFPQLGRDRSAAAADSRSGFRRLRIRC